jgi:hypothetical protein
MFIWCVLFPADLAQATCVLVIVQQNAEIQHYELCHIKPVAMGSPFPYQG